MELYADATGCTVVAPPECSDSVLLGTAMVAATAAGLYGNLPQSCIHMQQRGQERQPNKSASARFKRDYRIFLKMHEQRHELEKLSESSLTR
jgi:ribulose kinase